MNAKGILYPFMVDQFMDRMTVVHGYGLFVVIELYLFLDTSTLENVYTNMALYKYFIHALLTDMQ